jgi:hypothetical protein
VAKETVTASWSQAHFDFGAYAPKELLAFGHLALGFVSHHTLILFPNEPCSFQFVALPLDPIQG